MAEFTDAQMLDWLDQNNQALNARYGTTYGWKVIRSPNVVRVMTERRPADSGYVADVDVHDSEAHGHKSVRAAIAEAMHADGAPASDSKPMPPSDADGQPLEPSEALRASSTAKETK